MKDSIPGLPEAKKIYVEITLRDIPVQCADDGINRSIIAQQCIVINNKIIERIPNRIWVVNYRHREFHNRKLQRAIKLLINKIELTTNKEVHFV